MPTGLRLGKRDFQSTPAREELRSNSVMIDDYLRIINKSGWEHTHIIQAPMSAQRFSAVVVSAMQKKRILGVTSRYVIILKQPGSPRDPGQAGLLKGKATRYGKTN